MLLHTAGVVPALTSCAILWAVAGFLVSGHILRNEQILSDRDPEFKRYPHALLEPLAPIKIGES